MLTGMGMEQQVFSLLLRAKVFLLSLTQLEGDWDRGLVEGSGRSERGVRG